MKFPFYSFSLIFFLAFVNVANAQDVLDFDGKVTHSNSQNDLNKKSIIVVKQKLKQLLSEFARQHDMVINVSDNVKDSFVRSQKFSNDEVEFIREISNSYALDWYRRGDEYFLSNEKERASRMIVMGNVSVTDLQRELAVLVKNTDSFSLEEVSASNSLFISGPPSYVALVEMIVEGMINNSKVAINSVSVVRFGKRSTSATAQD